ncbi:MAG: hypothetical protein V3U86_04205 [Acidobacteriota bacterium]|nr:hypothetical protein [Acidobacteriota bacterium]
MTGGRSPPDEEERRYVDNFRTLLSESYVENFEFVTFEHEPRRF